MSEEIVDVTELGALDEKPEASESEDKVEESKPAEEPEEEPEEKEEKVPLGEAEEETPEEEKEESPKAIRFSEIKKEFPELFKKYPDLRANYFQAEKFKEYFPTIEDAEVAAKKAEALDYFEEQVRVGDLVSQDGLLDTISRNNPKALDRIADEILPKLFNLDTRLYTRATAPVIKQLLQFAGRQAQQSGDDNLKNSVLHLAKFVYGSANIPQDAPQQRQDDPEKLQLQQQNQQLLYNSASNYQNEVWSSGYEELKKEVLGELDTDKKFNSWQLDKLADDIMNDVNQVLLQDQRHQKEMASLWNHALQNGFPVDMKAKLISAHLARAKMIIPAIRQKRKSEALGTSTPENKQKRTLVPQNSGPARKSPSKIPSAQEAKKQGLSELDVLNRV